jgi:basic membrane lipoprotein Med (substrate-binding protein (PBP1-ABC) superfamily)
VTTSFSQSVAPSDAVKAMEGFIASGNELIVATGGQYAAAVQIVRQIILIFLFRRRK